MTTEPPLQQRQRPALSTGALVLAAVAMVVLGGVVGGLVVHLATRSSNAAPASVVVCDTVALADRVLPSVVTVQVSSADGAASNGTGEVIRVEGYILTNDHVVASAAGGGSIAVLFSNGETVPATLVGRATVLDLAVIKVEPATPLSVIDVFTGPLAVGQPVVALGSPLGLDGSVTRGIVSALGRDVRVPADGGGTALISGAIQTDATINPGNSGGPLVDCDGRMVGVNTAGATIDGSSGSIGIGFAIPAEVGVAVADEIIDTGTFSMPVFGLSVAPISPAAAGSSGLPAGLFVRTVTPSGPAAQAGLQEGDVITSVAGSPATSTDALTHVAVQSEPGDPVEVTYVRDGQTVATTVVLG